MLCACFDSSLRVMDQRRTILDPTVVDISDVKEYFREDDAFGSLTAVGPDDDVEEYKATQELLKSHASSAAAAAVTEVTPLSPIVDDTDSVVSAGDISITVEGAVRKRKFSGGNSAGLRNTRSGALENDDVILIGGNDDEGNYAQIAEADISRSESLITGTNQGYKEDSYSDYDSDGDKKPAAAPRGPDISNGNHQDGGYLPAQNIQNDAFGSTDIESGPVYAYVAESLLSLYVDMQNIDEKEAEMQQSIYDNIKAAAPTIGKDQWKCPACTFINDSADALVCSICESQRIERNERTDPPMRGLLEDDSIEIRPKVANGENCGENEGDHWIIFEHDKHICFGWGIGTPSICYIRYVGREEEKSIEMEWRKTQRRGRSREAGEKEAVGRSRHKSRETTVIELQAEPSLSNKKQKKRKKSDNYSSPTMPTSAKGRERNFRPATQKKYCGEDSSDSSPGSDEVGAATSSPAPCHTEFRLEEPFEQGTMDDSNEDSNIDDVESTCDESVSWTCNFCNFFHENMSADFLACKMCSAPREQTDVAKLRTALSFEDASKQAPPRISFDCPQELSLKSSSFPLVGVETIEAFMYPNGNINRKPEWTVVSTDHHLCHEENYDREKMSGTCAMSWIRQGDSRPFTTRWRVCTKRASRGSAPVLFSAEQVENDARRRPAFKKKRAIDDSSKEDGFTSDSASADSSNKRQKRGYLEKRLGMSMDEIEKAMPKALAERVHDCVWVSWKGKDGGKVYHPALILRPADISGKTDALKLVGTMIEKAIRMNRPDLWNKHLVFWYSYGFSWAKKGPQKDCKAFTLEEPENLVPYTVGVERGYHQPKELTSKISSPNLISWREGCFLDGLKQIKKDAEVEKHQRGGPFFFEHQRQMLRNEAKRLQGERELRIDMERENKAAKRDQRRVEERAASNDQFNSRFVNTDLCSLELCSGQAKMTEGLRKAGFRHVVTLDNDPKKKSVSNLSLKQLEDIIEGINGDQRWQHHPTHKCFHTIWAGPCCTTYSIAQSTKIYRTKGECAFDVC